MREQVLVANGLWPMPDKTPLNPVIHGKIDRDDYTIEKVFFASYPGHYVSGNLYRPKGKTGKLPGVLCPHGHWANGRFFEAGDKAVAGRSKQGAEKTLEGAPLSAASPLRPARPHGLRRLPLRHGRRRRQQGRSPIATASPTPRPNCVCKASWACKRGTASAPSISC